MRIAFVGRCVRINVWCGDHGFLNNRTSRSQDVIRVLRWNPKQNSNSKTSRSEFSCLPSTLNVGIFNEDSRPCHILAFLAFFPSPFLPLSLSAMHLHLLNAAGVVINSCHQCEILIAEADLGVERCHSFAFLIYQQTKKGKQLPPASSERQSPPKVSHFHTDSCIVNVSRAFRCSLRRCHAWKFKRDERHRWCPSKPCC